MAFSLGYKERIVLDGTEMTFDGVTAATSAYTAVGGDLEVKGLGKIVRADVTAASISRAYPQKYSTASFTMSLEADKTYEIAIQVETFRYQADLATDFIHFKRPIIIQFKADGDGPTDADTLKTIFDSLFGPTRS